MIGKLLFPIMKKFSKLMIAMIFVSALAVALLVGMADAKKTLIYSIDRYLEDFHCTDITITTEKTDAAIMSQIASLPDVEDVNARMAGDVPVRLPNGRLISVRVFSTGLQDFQHFYIHERNESTKYPNVGVEARFANGNGIKAGDMLEVKVNGEFEKVQVGSIVSSPECLGAIRDEYAWGENSDFGFLFAPELLAYDTELYQQCDQFLICTRSGANDESIMHQAEAILAQAGVEVKNSMLFEDSPVKARIDFDVDPLEVLLYIVPSVFFVSTLLVMVLFLSQILNQCRREIGILRAFGFAREEIRALFCAITLIITLIASVLGIAASFPLRNTIIKYFAAGMGLPMTYMKVDTASMFLGVVILLLCGQAATLYSTVKLSSIMPSEAMSRATPSSNETPAILTKLLSEVKPEVKFSITSMCRNVKRFVFSTCCIAVTMALILLSVSFYVSKEFMLDDTFDNRFHYDAQIFVKNEPTEEMLSELSHIYGVSNVEVMTYLRTTLSYWGGSEEITVCGLPENTKDVTIFNEKRHEISVPSTGIILVSHLADELGIRVGDTVTVNGTKLLVTGLSDQSLNWMNHVSASTMETIGPVDHYSIFCRATNENALIEQICEWEDYEYTNLRSTSRASNERQFVMYNIAVFVLIGFAVTMGLLIVYNTTEMNLFEQKKTLSVLRTLGFQVNDISKIWFIQTLLQFILSTVIGLTSGTLISKAMLLKLAGKERFYPFVSDPTQFIISAGIVLLYVAVSHMLAMRSVGKWDLVENIKEKE